MSRARAREEFSLAADSPSPSSALSSAPSAARWHRAWTPRHSFATSREPRSSVLSPFASLAAKGAGGAGGAGATGGERAAREAQVEDAEQGDGHAVAPLAPLEDRAQLLGDGGL